MSLDFKIIYWCKFNSIKMQTKLLNRRQINGILIQQWNLKLSIVKKYESSRKTNENAENFNRNKRNSYLSTMF